MHLLHGRRDAARETVVAQVEPHQARGVADAGRDGAYQLVVPQIQRGQQRHVAQAEGQLPPD